MLYVFLFVLSIFAISCGFLGGFMGSWPQTIRKLSKQKYTNCKSYDSDTDNLNQIIETLDESGILKFVVGLHTTSEDKKWLKENAKNGDAEQSDQMKAKVLMNYWMESNQHKLACNNNETPSSTINPLVYTGNNPFTTIVVETYNDLFINSPLPTTCSKISEVSMNWIKMVVDKQREIGAVIDDEFYTHMDNILNTPENAIQNKLLFGVESIDADRLFQIFENSEHAENQNCVLLDNTRMFIPQPYNTAHEDAIAILDTIHEMDSNNVVCDHVMFESTNFAGLTAEDNRQQQTTDFETVFVDFYTKHGKTDASPEDINFDNVLDACSMSFQSR